MTMTLAVSAVQVTGWRARVSLTVTSPTVGATITLYRDDLSGVLVPVLGASGMAPVSAVVDDVPGLNRPTWWRAIASTGETAVTATPLTVASTLPVLSDPRGGRAVQVTIKEFNELQVDSTTTSVLVDVEDPAVDDAVVWLIGPDGPRTAAITLRTDDGPSLTEARAILRAGRALLLRGSQPGVEDPWLVLKGRSERRVTNNVTDWRRYLVLDVGIPLSAPDPSVPVLGDTLGDLAAAFPTLGAINAAYATLGAIAQADLKAL